MKNIIKIEPQGFCMGVKRAIAMAHKIVKDHPNETIYCLGMLVHNRFVIESLNGIGIITLDTSIKSPKEYIDEIDEGIILLTAHGTSDELIQYIENKGLKIYDATCLYVLKTKKLILKELEEGKDILYLGKKNHPETNAMVSIDQDRIHLITTLDEAKTMELPDIPYCITTQTTLSLFDVKEITDVLMERFPKANLQPEICLATQHRQEAILFGPSFDAIIVIGDPKSNNTRQLANIAQKKSTHVYAVEHVDQIKEISFNDIESIGVTSGASTPDHLVEEVIQYLQTLA